MFIENNTNNEIRSVCLVFVVHFFDYSSKSKDNTNNQKRKMSKRSTMCTKCITHLLIVLFFF